MVEMSFQGFIFFGIFLILLGRFTMWIDVQWRFGRAIEAKKLDCGIYEVVQAFKSHNVDYLVLNNGNEELILVKNLAGCCSDFKNAKAVVVKKERGKKVIYPLL